MRTETTVHRVAKIEITDRRFHESDTNPFWAREIVITDEDGNTHTPALTGSRRLSSTKCAVERVVMWQMEKQK